MDQRDDELLSIIVKRNLHLDRKSKETITSKIKPKYKLAGNPILQQYFFHVLTTTKDACKKTVTLIINDEDWEERAIDLPKDIGYCDLRKYELMDKLELLGKLKDTSNEFPYIAKLSLLKYEQLQKLNEKMLHHPYISMETKRIVTGGLSDKADEIAKKLKLI